MLEQFLENIPNSVSRRDFLKLSTLFASVLLAACAPVPIIPTPVSPSLTPPPPTETATPKVISPTVTKTVTVTETPVKETETTFDLLMKPFIEEALKKRELRRKNEPEWSKKIDEELNSGRINFLLFGHGQTYEPKEGDEHPSPQEIGSSTIVSYDIKNKRIDFISLTHDIRASEIEWYLRDHNAKEVPAQKIDQAYKVGGFDLLRQVHEDATGLIVDFQVSFKDRAIQLLVDNVLGRVEVDVPEDFDVMPYYLDGKLSDKSTHFSKGKQKLTGEQVIQFIKTVPVPPDPNNKYYGRPLEHKSRMYYVFRGILDNLQSRDIDDNFIKNLIQFLTVDLLLKLVGKENIDYDFDMRGLLINNLDKILSIIQTFRSKGKNKPELPTIGKTIYIHTEPYGDGGVQWINPESTDTFIKKDYDKKVYPPDKKDDMAVPFNGDAFSRYPYLDYWPSLRNKIKELLLN